MTRTFYFPSALVVEEKDFIRVRFWARTKDTLDIGLDGPRNYKENANIVLLVNGGVGSPNFPGLPPGTATYPGTAIEVHFKGACTATMIPRVGGGGNALRVVVAQGSLEVASSVGLPYEAEELLDASLFTMGGDVGSGDPDPHPPPPPSGN